MRYTPAEVDAAVEKAEAAASRGHWQDVQLHLAPVREELGERPGALYQLAYAYSAVRNVEPALAVACEAMESARRNGSDLHSLKAANLLGIIHFETGRLDDAREHFTRALALARDLGEERIEAMIANNLGNLAGLQGRHETARDHYRDALRTYRSIGESRGIAQTLHNLGIFHRDRGELEEADRLFTEAAREAQQVGDHALFAVAVVARAELELRQGRMQRAEQMARAALLRFDVHASLFGLAEAHRILGIVAREGGDAAQALQHFDQALEYCSLHENPLIEAETRLERGVLIQRTTGHDAAEGDLLAACRTLERLGAHAQAERARALARRPDSQGTIPG